MRTILIVASVMTWSLPAAAMLGINLKVNGTSYQWTYDPVTQKSTAKTDASDNGSTVGFELWNNVALSRWQLDVKQRLNASYDLNNGTDVNSNSTVEITVQKFPNGNPQGVRSMYFQGNLLGLDYKDSTDMIQFTIKPVIPAKTVSYASGYTAALGADFYYGGMASAPITYSPPFVAGNVFRGDRHLPTHPSSELLWGKAVRVDGINGEPVNLNFVFANSYANRWSFPLDNMKCFLDGEPPTVPSTGFSYSGPIVPSFPVNMGIAGDSYKMLTAINLKFSAHDIQAGVFRPRPQFTTIKPEAGGLRVNWNAETNRRYILEYFATLGGPTNILGTNLAGPSFLDPAGTTNASRFYRLREQ